MLSFKETPASEGPALCALRTSLFRTSVLRFAIRSFKLSALCALLLEGPSPINVVAAHVAQN